MRIATIVLACILVLLAAIPASVQGQMMRPQMRAVPQNLIIVVIPTRYIDPSDVAWLFGGQIIQGGGMYGGGSGGSGYGGGNSGYGGSNRGSSGSSGRRQR